MIVVLEPIKSCIGDDEPLIRDLDPSRILVSPWSVKMLSNDDMWKVVVNDTLLLFGKDSLAVRPPSVLPGPGTGARGGESYLSISPLDCRREDG